MVPWELFIQNPSYAFLVPFAWVLWQVYTPRIVNRVVGKDPSKDYIYETWYTKTKSELKTDIKSNLENVDERVGEISDDVSKIADTQEKLTHVTIAQTHMLNGYDGDIDVEEVEKDLTNDDQSSPTDYLNEDYGGD